MVARENCKFPATRREAPAPSRRVGALSTARRNARHSSRRFADRQGESREQQRHSQPQIVGGKRPPACFASSSICLGCSRLEFGWRQRLATLDKDDIARFEPFEDLI